MTHFLNQKWEKNWEWSTHDNEAEIVESQTEQKHISPLEMCVRVLHDVSVFNIDSSDTSSSILCDQDDLYF